MDKSLEGKRAIVTGGSRGIGRAIAERLLRDGARVAICGRSEAGVREAVGELSATPGGLVVGRATDVRDFEQVKDLFTFVDTHLGGVDILVNNAGVGVFSSVRDMTPEDWRQTIDTNLSGVFYCSREALRRFGSPTGGFIVNISSLAGKNPFAGGAAYNASKFGLNGFSEAMMLDHRYEDVRVCYVMPGSVATGFSTRSDAADWKIAPEDVAEIVSCVLAMPERTLISRVEVRPSRPGK